MKELEQLRTRMRLMESVIKVQRLTIDLQRGLLDNRKAQIDLMEAREKMRTANVVPFK
jgi:hypothetical protein